MQTCCYSWAVEGNTWTSRHSCFLCNLGFVCTDGGQFDWTQFPCNCQPRQFSWNTNSNLVFGESETCYCRPCHASLVENKHTCPQLHTPCLNLLAAYQLSQKVNKFDTFQSDKSRPCFRFNLFSSAESQEIRASVSCQRGSGRDHGFQHKRPAGMNIVVHNRKWLKETGEQKFTFGLGKVNRAQSFLTRSY